MTSRRSSLRLRLTVLYSALFLAMGAALLVFAYAVVRDNFDRANASRSVELRSSLQSARSTAKTRVRVRIAPGLPAETSPVLRRLTAPERTAYLRARQAVLAADRRAEDAAQRRVLLWFAGALVALTLVSVGAGWLLAGRALAPIARITATARRISERTLDERIGLAGPRDELRELADTFDRMLDRLSAAFDAQRRFAAEASHELRTPLAIVRTEVDVALADPDAPVEELREMGEVVREANDRMERLIDALLTLAQGEAGALRREPADLADAARRAFDEALGDDIVLEAGLAPAPVDGDPVLLQRLAANLLENAVRYNRAGGRVVVRTGVAGPVAFLEVVNDGPRIPPEDVEALFAPFGRRDPSRSRATGGYGLGLAVVRSVAAAHGGTAVAAARPEGGLRVRVELAAGPQAVMSASGTLVA